jgi:hypothetical protein
LSIAKEIIQKYRSPSMEMEKIAHVNEMQIIGKVLKSPEKLKAANGKPFLRVLVETERFVIMPDKSRQRIAQTHTVVIRRQATITMFEANVRPGVTIRIVGELCYDPKPEIVVWEYLGTAVLMSIPHPAVSTPAEKTAQATTASEPKTVSAAPSSAVRQAPVSSGGPSRMAVGNKPGAQQAEPEFTVDGDDDDGDEGSQGGAIFNSNAFQTSSNLLDDIPF